MNSRIEALIEQISDLERQLEAAFAKRRAELRFGIEKGRVIFEQEILRRHKELRIGITKYVLQVHPLLLLTAPLVYSLIIPLILLDVFVTIYQRVCFPLYGLSKVCRGDHIIFDRHHLKYLNAIQKFNCAYCSYANGLISYVREIAGRTEQYWCPIKHARRVIRPHSSYVDFADYGDADNFHQRLEAQRKNLKEK